MSPMSDFHQFLMVTFVMVASPSLLMHMVWFLVREFKRGLAEGQRDKAAGVRYDRP